MNDSIQILTIGVDAMSFSFGFAVGALVSAVAAVAGLVLAAAIQATAPMREGMAG